MKGQTDGSSTSCAFLRPTEGGQKRVLWRHSTKRVCEAVHYLRHALIHSSSLETQINPTIHCLFRNHSITNHAASSESAFF